MKRRQAGYTLLEVVLTSVMTGIMVLSFGVTVLLFVEKAGTAHAESASREELDAVVAQIERAIRMSEVVEKAGDDILVLTTRYWIDDEDDEETIVYERVGSTLTRQVDGGPVETLLTGVDAFMAKSIEIEDEFLAVDYDAVLPEGDDRSADTEIQAKYKIKELGDVDPDLMDAFDAAGERLEVYDATRGVLVTVTPALPREDLAATITFVPLVEDKRYHPISYGEATDSGTGVTIQFRPGLIVVARVINGDDPVEFVQTDYAWKVGHEYQVGFQVTDEKGVFWVDDGTGPAEVGAVSMGSEDNHPIHLATRAEARAYFDDLRVWNPIVKFQLTVDLSGVGQGPDVTATGSAAPRQP